MKYIFDFDDVLFNNTSQFKKHMYKILAESGIPENKARERYLEVREKGFSIKNFINALQNFVIVNKINPEELHEKIMVESKNFVNLDIVEIIKHIGKANCYLVTNGLAEYQLDKIKRTRVDSLFSEIIVVPGTKKEAIEKICAKHINEKVIFVDDKEKRFSDLDFKKFPNLKTILYDEQGLDKLKAEI